MRCLSSFKIPLMLEGAFVFSPFLFEKSCFLWAYGRIVSNVIFILRFFFQPNNSLFIASHLRRVSSRWSLLLPIHNTIKRLPTENTLLLLTFGSRLHTIVRQAFFGQIFVTLLKCRKMNGVHELEERAALRRVISHLFVYTTVIITYGSVQKSQQVVFRMLTLMAFLWIVFCLVFWHEIQGKRCGLDSV